LKFLFLAPFGGWNALLISLTLGRTCSTERRKFSAEVVCLLEMIWAFCLRRPFSKAFSPYWHAYCGSSAAGYAENTEFWHAKKGCHSTSLNLKTDIHLQRRRLCCTALCLESLSFLPDAQEGFAVKHS
jgi:hypothetical protein